MPYLKSPTDWGTLYDTPLEWPPWLHSQGTLLRAVVDTVIDQALKAESVLVKFKRTRVRKAKDFDVFKRTIDSLVSHVVYEYLRGAGPVSISLANDVLMRSTRYLSDLQSMQLPKIIKLLGSTDLGFLTVIPGMRANGFTAGRLTRISAGPRLVSRLEGVFLDDVARRPGEEIVLLKSDRDDETGLANLIDYPDNAIADEARTEVGRINAHLASADIEYLGTSKLFDERKRHLVRRFTRGSWGSGGRLWGGFWDSPMTKSQRLNEIRISSDHARSSSTSHRWCFAWRTPTRARSLPLVTSTRSPSRARPANLKRSREGT